MKHAAAITPATITEKQRHALVRRLVRQLMAEENCMYHELNQEITGAQIRAARGLLGWSRDVLADSAGVSLRTLASIEAGRANPTGRTIELIVVALQNAGIRFIKENGGGPGVRMRRRSRR